jgi:hypothetical protein
LCLFLVIRVLAPGFNRALAALENAPSRRSEIPGGVRRTGGLSARLSRWFCSSPDERAAFELLWSVASRDRPFKLATYPMVAFVFLVMLVFLFRDEQGMAYAFERLTQSPEHLFFLYFASFLGPVAVLQLRYSDQHEAAWIYHALPVARPGVVLSAGLKMVLARFSAPLFGLVTAVVLVLWGIRILWDVLLVVCVLIGFSLVAALFFGRRFPFSEKRSGQQASGQSGKGFVFLIILAAAGGIHYGLTQIPGAVPAAVLVSVATLVFLFRAYRRTAWSRIEEA